MGLHVYAAGEKEGEDGVTKDTILIGAYGPLTGSQAFIGLGTKAGMELAVQEINEAGGIHGRKLKVLHEDDGYLPARALVTVKKYIERDKVFMIYGISGSNASIGTLDYVKDLKVPNYFSIASAPPITHPYNRYLFRGATGESARYGELYSEFLYDHLKARKIAFFRGNDENARNESENVISFLKKWFNLDPLIREEFKMGDKDFTAQLLRIRQAGPDVVAISGGLTEVAIIIRQARELGLQMPLFIGTSAIDPAIITTGGQAAEGVIGPWSFPHFPDSDHPDIVKFRTAWQKLNPNAPPGRPSYFDMCAYGDMYVIAEGLRRAGPDLTREKFIDALETLVNYRVSEVATPRTFTNWHHIGNNTLVMHIVQNQRWVPIDWQPKHESEIYNDLKK